VEKIFTEGLVETLKRKENGLEKCLNRKKIFYGILAVGLFCLLFLFTFHSRMEGMERQEVEIVTFGDSVFGEIRDDTAVPAQLQRLLGKTVYNAALGGTCMARQNTDGRLDHAGDSLSLAGLSKAVWAGDFGVQQAGRMRESNTEYFPEVIDGLETIDFSRVEIVLIQQGLNDYHAGIPIENPEAPYDEYTFLGALRSAVKSLRKANPALRIVLVTPTYTWYLNSGLTCEEMNQGNGVLEDYVEAELRAADELGIEVIDVYHDFFPHETWEDWKLFSRDGLHPDEAGRVKLAGRIAEVLGESGTLR